MTQTTRFQNRQASFDFGANLNCRSWLAAMFFALLSGLVASTSFAAPGMPRQAPSLNEVQRALTQPEQFAWELFIAVNWPANAKQPFGGNAPAQWGAWKDTTEVFLSAGKKPARWSQPDDPPADPTKTNLRLSDGIILSSSADPSFVTGGLRDINNVPIYSEIRMNKVAFEHVLANELYNVEGQLAFLAENKTLRMPEGAVEVKASWRVLHPVKDRAIQGRYFQAEGILQTPDGKKTRVKLGLNSMNIMFKLRDQWFWTAFEQVDNAAQTYNIGFPEVALALRIDPATQAVNKVWKSRLAGTVWANYRSNGAQINYVNSDGTPTFLTNTQQETDILKTSSCIGCHAYSAIGRVAGVPSRLFPLKTSNPDGTGTGYLGTPNPQYLRDYVTLDFMWSFIEASPKNPANATQFLMVTGAKPSAR